MSQSQSNVISFDDFLPIEKIIMRDTKTKKIMFGYYTEEDNLMTYLSPDLTYQDLLFLIDTLNQRKEAWYVD